MMRLMFIRTKIVCTIGPAVSSYEKIVQLIEAGMNVARLNFSHGTHEDHLKQIQVLKKARQALNQPVAIMLDMHGPKIRIGNLPNGSISFKAKQRFILGKDIPIEAIEIFEGLKKGAKILFDDGYIISTVVDQLTIEMENDGVLKSAKGVSIPGAHISLPAVTPGDIEDLKFGCKHDVDIVAASFVRSAHDIMVIKEILEKEGNPNIQIIAKIESMQGVENFDSIVQIANGIMVARGDMGVEMDLALIPKL